MRNACAVTALSFLFCCAPAGAQEAVPLLYISGAAQQKNAPRDASGTITAVASDAFTLRVSRKKASGVMIFATNAETTIDGKLQVGAKASVTFRVDAQGRNVATKVHVTPPSQK